MLEFKSNMEIAQFVIGVAVIISVNFFIIKIIYNWFRASKLTEDELKFDQIRKIYKTLKKGKNPKENVLKQYADNLEHRILVYNALEKFSKQHLFPTELLSIENSSESYLANWLNDNDDFDSFPDELKFQSKTTLQNGITNFIFNYKVFRPHPFAKREL